MNNQDLQLISDSSESTQMYTFSRPYPQNFCFRTPIMIYILQNSPGKTWKKLIQTCKYFYSKNLIYPVARLEASFATYHCDSEILDQTKPFPSLWFYDTFFASSDSLKRLTLCSSYVKYSDGTYVTVDKLLERLETVKRLILYCKPSMFEADTVQKMLKIIPRFKNLKEMHLEHLTENFDIASFMTFIMKNQNVKFRFGYVYNTPVSYREMLGNFVDQILENPPINVPLISWSGQNHAKWKKLVRLSRA